MNDIRAAQLARYSFLAVPLAFGSLPLYLYMPDFYARQFGIPLAALGIVLLGIRAFDAVQDPLLGLWGRHLHGRRLRRCMFAAFVLLALSVLALAAPPDSSHALLWFSGMMLLSTGVLSFITILYQSAGALWSDDYHTRTRITAWREGFTLLGVVIAVCLPQLLHRHMTERDAIALFGVVFSALIAIAGSVWLRHSAKNETRRPVLPPAPFRFALLSQHRRFFCIWFLSQLASAVPVVLVLFFIRDRLHLEDYTGLFLILYFLAGAAGMPVWSRLAKRFGKRAAWGMAMFLAIVSFLWAFSLDSGDLLGYALICVFSGFALGGEMALPPSILADRITAGGDEDQTALLFGIAAFIGKLSLALASGIALPLLGWQGYAPGSQNSAEATTLLAIAYALAPCAIKATALVLLMGGDIENHKEKRSLSCLSAHH